MKMLLWEDATKCIVDALGSIPLDTKPVFSFEYESIRFYTKEKIFKTQDGTEQPLSIDQQNEILAFIEQTRGAAGMIKHCIDSSGQYLGQISIDDPRVDKAVPFAPPNGDDWVWEEDKSNWARAYHYDANGYTTVARAGNSTGFTKIPYPKNKNPITFRFDIEQNDWVVDSSRPEMLNIVRNKIIFDSVMEYVRFNLSIGTQLNAGVTDFAYLSQVINVLTNMQTWREANILDANVNTMISTVDSNLLQLIESSTSVEQTLLETHEKSELFLQNLGQKLKDHFYSVNKQILEETVIEDFINNQ